MAGNMGAVLSGLANGLSAVPQQLNDLAFQQQSRQQALQAGSIQNQMAAFQLQQAQQAQQTQQDYQNQMVAAWQGSQDTPDQSATAAAPVAAGQPAAANAPQGSGNAYGNLAPLQRAGITLAQLDNLAKQNGVPTDIAYGVLASESQGNPNAVSPKGALGPFQVMPATAGQPGFGVQPFDPKSPAGALSYMGAMWKKAGGDPAKFTAMWNAGPGGNPNNPETQGFTKNVLTNAKSFQLSQAATQAAQQPSPADQIAAREAAGVSTPAPAYQQATQAQSQQIKMLMTGYNQAMQAGKPAVAQMFLAQAQKAQQDQVELQTRGLAVQKTANEETAKLATGVNDQSSYNNLQAQIKQNPAMQSAVAGLGLTGNYDLDRNKLQTLASRSETLKDQQEIQIKQQELQLKQQIAQREQQKADLPKIAAAQAQQADALRQQTVAKSGVPFTPSLAATAPIGTTPAQIQQAQKAIQTQNAAYDKANAPAVQGAKNLSDLAAQAYVAVANKTVSTGGMWNAGAEAIADRKGFGGGSYLLSAEQQEFNKLTANMVQQMQLLAGANGGARSASTAAMYNNYARAKPNINLSPEANMAVAHGLYVGAAAQRQMNDFLDRYRQANPDATVQSGVAQWHRYETAAGPTMIFDPASRTMVPNTVTVPTLEDGTPNPAYKDPNKFFSEGHF